MAPVVTRYPDLRGEMHDLFDTLALSPDSIAFKLRVDEISATWV